MHLKKLFLVTKMIILLIFCISLPARADSVRVGIGFSLPPYVIKEQDRGLEVDIIREALEIMGHEVTFVYLPSLRLAVDLQNGNVDCVAANAAYDVGADAGIPTYSSDVTLTYQNFAIALAKNNFPIKSIADLRNWRVFGFNNAAKYLGKEFAAMVKDNPLYSERADQALQVRLLYSERVEVVVSDKRIFLYWRKQLADLNLQSVKDLSQGVDFFPIFPPAPRDLTFRDIGLRDEFNDGLSSLMCNGVYDALHKEYAGIEQ